MRSMTRTAVAVGGLMVMAGCRTATRVTEVPRVDLELSGGNRGYLVGSPPPAESLKTTRQILQSDVEVPSFYKPKHSRTPVSLDVIAPPQMEDAADASGAAPAAYDSYVVQKGDSLWSIAAKPEVYGKATMWRRLFDANRDVLKSPDQVRAGMTLKIPRDEGESMTSYSDEGISYKK